MSDQSGHVLLSHRRDLDLRNLPGGGVEQDETPWDAAIREVLEETGLAVTVVRLVGIYCMPVRNGITLRFECIVTGGSLQVSDLKHDGEYKLLLGCTVDKISTMERFHTSEYTACVVVRRGL